MDLTEFRRYRVTLICGPQRAGTTLVARCVEYSAGLSFVDEDEYGTKDVDAWRHMVRTGSHLVIHSPAMSRWCHEFGDKENVAVVWVVRPLHEIIASQDRIGWTGSKSESDERGKYKDVRPLDIARGVPTAEIKNRYWRLYQKPRIRHAFEICYHSLAGHPLWVPPAERVDFDKRQWQVEVTA